MVETVEVVRQFPSERAIELAPRTERLFLTGEGSSRIFPAKRARVDCLRNSPRISIEIEGADQACEYALDGYHAFVGSNSGRTAEAVRFVHALNKRTSGSPVRTTAVVADGTSPLADACDDSFVLTCGKEDAVAATKSVVEQALFYDTVIRHQTGRQPLDQEETARAIALALAVEIPPEIVSRIERAPRIYFAGRNDGVAEELTLKTNEIIRKPSAYLEGTYAVHGIEEIMNRDEVVIVIDPFPEEEEKFDTVLRGGVGLEVVAIAARPTRFPTILVPDSGEATAPYAYLAAGWNVLVEVGLARGIDIDRPERARKVGNEFTSS
jgi:glucosamine--fructose-6-phosphate aminotransferase (isomerizing)